ncbi:uncharacterized protein METZ01_LOCUS397158, partial [marine metagenome]
MLENIRAFFFGKTFAKIFYTQANHSYKNQPLKSFYPYTFSFG